MEWEQESLDGALEATAPIPFVIDNREPRLHEVLNRLLQRLEGCSLDIATAYFNVGGWQLLQNGLERLGSFRLLIGDEIEAGGDVGLREAGARPVRGLIKELDETPFQEHTLRSIERLLAFLRDERVLVRRYTGGFLHAKAYLFYLDRDFSRVAPHAAIVGSSNFTRAGLLSSQELNLVHRASLEADEIEPAHLKGLMESAQRKRLLQLPPEERVSAANVPGLLAMQQLNRWYEQRWSQARDFKDELIELLNASKFGRKEYTPYQIYTKAIFEYFRDYLEADEASNVRSAIELAEFQEDAVRRARKILARYDGVLVADSVGLGKTWIGKKLLEDYAYHRRYRALLICPAALQKMWHEELLRAGISAQILTQEALGRAEFEPREFADADVVLIDESHNFRNRHTQRYDNLERILAGNQRTGAISGQRKKLILLTATPINNSVMDLYSQISLFIGGDRAYFANAGIGDLPRYFQNARRADRQQESGVALFNLLEEIAIRRTRPFIKRAYPNATINGQPIHWPERRLRTIRYNLEGTYAGIYARIVERIEALRLAPYRLESYKRRGIERDQFEEGREEALVGIFKSRYLKRFESSIDAFRISVRRALEFLETFESYILDGRVLDSSSFQKALRFLAREDEEDDASGNGTPNSRADELDASAEASAFIASLPTLDAAQYDLKRLHRDLRRDVDALRALWSDIERITPEQDVKLARLKELLSGELRGQKVLIFTYYKDTARYLARQLCENTAAAVAWRASAGEPHIRRMDSGADARERARLVAQFSPRSNRRPELAGTPEEIDILISTDVLSEGQNLQDCGVLINYDLHWNPTRMIQRAGRIDRLGSSFDTLWIMNMFPDDGLERLLGLVESLAAKIAAIDSSGLLDASILGETVHPQNFNTLRRIAEEDGRVIEEQEQFAELVSNEFLLQNLKGLLNSGLRTTLEELPDGIHSGLHREGARGVFFYFVAPDPGAPDSRQHYWRYLDLRDGTISDNRYLISSQIQCLPETPRVLPLPSEVDIFAWQEKVIASILQSAAQQAASIEAPKILDPVQQQLTSILRLFLQTPGFERKEVAAAMRAVNVPQPRVYLKAMRKALETYQKDGLGLKLVQELAAIEASTAALVPKQAAPRLKREDLKLICFEYVW